MVAAPEYDLPTQTKLVPAICVLHNFIRVHDPNDDVNITEVYLSRRAPRRTAQDFSTQISNQEKARANARQDEIAKGMWRQYQEYLAEN